MQGRNYATSGFGKQQIVKQQGRMGDRTKLFSMRKQNDQNADKKRGKNRKTGQRSHAIKHSKHSSEKTKNENERSQLLMSHSVESLFFPTQGFPPFSSGSLFRNRVFMPGPQGFEHVPHSFHGPHLQSEGKSTFSMDV